MIFELRQNGEDAVAQKLLAKYHRELISKRAKAKSFCKARNLADAMKRRKKRLLGLGLCTTCGKYPLAKRSVSRCESCLKKHRKKYK